MPRIKRRFYDGDLGGRKKAPKYQKPSIYKHFGKKKKR